MGPKCTMACKSPWFVQLIFSKFVFNDSFDALRKIVQTEGMRGLYRGSAVMVVLITPRDAVRFSANDYFRFYLKDKTTK